MLWWSQSPLNFWDLHSPHCLALAFIFQTEHMVCDLFSFFTNGYLPGFEDRIISPPSTWPMHTCWIEKSLPSARFWRTVPSQAFLSSKYLEHVEEQAGFENTPCSWEVIRLMLTWLGFPNTQEHPISVITLNDFKADLEHSGVLGTEATSWVAVGMKSTVWSWY